MTELELALQADERARQDALDIDQSFCVSAPAGSGKTELLTQRILKLLATVDEPERVVAITFTRKAAAEMRERLFNALDEAAAVVRGELLLDAVSPHRALTLSLAQAVLEQNEKRGWRLMHSPGRLRIQTFDSLCNAIVQSEPLASRVGGALKPTDNADVLYERAIEQYFLELHDAGVSEASADTPQNNALVDLLNYFYNRQYFVKSLLLDMLRARDQWLPYVNRLVLEQSRDSGEALRQEFETILQKLIEHGLLALIRSVQGDGGDLLALAQHARAQLRKNNYTDIGKGSVLQALESLGDTLPDSGAKNLSVWLAIAELLFTQASPVKARSRPTKSTGFPAKGSLKGEEQQRNEAMKALLVETATRLASQDESSEAFNNLRQLPLAVDESAQGQHDVLNMIARCLQRLSAYLQLQFYQHGACDHAAIQSAALEALGANESQQPGAIEYRWHRAIEHLLVDEFQDTSIAQYRLIAALTRHWPESANAQSAAGVDAGESVRRSLFVVGDGMQSIYAFRNANVGLFLKAAESGIGGQALMPLRLAKNFRSGPALVNWFNAQFSATFPRDSDAAIGAVSYEHSVSAQASTEEQHTAAVAFTGVVEDALIEDKNERTAEARQREALHIASLIQRLRKQRADASIAILLRGRSHGSELFSELDDRGIAWEGVDLAPLSSREVVMDLLTLHRATSNLADDIAWWAMLRAPWCGLLLKDMQALRVHIDSDDSCSRLADFLLIATPQDLERVPDLSEDARSRLLLLSSALQEYWALRGKAPQRDLLGALWKRLGGDALASACLLGSASQAALVSDLSTAEAMLDLIEDFELDRLDAPGSYGLASLQSRVDRLYAQSAPVADGEPESEGQSASGGSVRRPVQIMTMHKAKGLEFDHVILPALARDSGRNDQPILRSREVVVDGGEGVLLAPKPESSLYADSYQRLLRERGSEQDRRAQSVYDYLKYLESKASALESERLLYVAATRACESLHLSACLKADEDCWPPAHISELDAPRKGTLLANGWDQICAAPDSMLTITLSLPAEPDERSATALAGDKPDTTQGDELMAIRRWSAESVQVLVRALEETRVASVTSSGGESPRGVGSGGDVSCDEQNVAQADRDSGNRYSAENAGGERQRLAGIVYHEMMMRFGNANPAAQEYWVTPGASQQALLTHLHQQAARRERIIIGQSDLAEAVALVQRALSSTLTGEHGRWLLDAGHKQRQNEAAHVVLSDGRSSESRIDCSFVDAGGVHWVIDYKLHDDRDTRDEQSIISAYRSQLSHYRAILRSELGGESGQKPEIKTALYLPLSDKLLILNEI